MSTPDIRTLLAELQAKVDNPIRDDDSENRAIGFLRKLKTSSPNTKGKKWPSRKRGPDQKVR
jgi:hypothetical protein